MMRYLITGGAGFIGSHLAEKLLREGHGVTIIDDLCTGSIQNIEHLKSKRNFNYIIDSIFNRPLLAELIDDCDAVFHLAAAVGVKLIVESPVRTVETNVKGTETVLELAAKKKKKVLIASTSEVYGKSRKIPFTEDDDLVMGPTSKGRWSYACSKAIDEFLALAYWKEKKLPVVIARLFNTVGPRQTGRYGMVLPTFVRQALAGEPLTVFGDGKQSRCFCHVSDTVGVLFQLIEHPGAVGGIFNVGGEEEIAIGELADLVKTMTRSASAIRYIAYDQAYEQGFEDMHRRVPDVSKIKNLVDFRTTHDTRQIVQSVIDHHLAIPAKPRRVRKTRGSAVAIEVTAGS
jgi:UDP-glucose 4-epimerase